MEKVKEDDRYVYYWDDETKRKIVKNKQLVYVTIHRPNHCRDCELRDLSIEGDWLCLPAGRKWIETQRDEPERIPEWCPLRSFPLKKNTDFCRNIPYANGWNDCIEEIKNGN